jgi:hypothetical protein
MGKCVEVTFHLWSTLVFISYEMPFDHLCRLTTYVQRHSHCVNAVNIELISQ